MEKFGFEPEEVFGLILDSYVLNEAEISAVEKKNNVSPGMLVVETYHGDFFEDECKNFNFYTSIKDGNFRKYYFKEMKNDRIKAY